MSNEVDVMCENRLSSRLYCCSHALLPHYKYVSGAMTDLIWTWGIYLIFDSIKRIYWMCRQSKDRSKRGDEDYGICTAERNERHADRLK